MGSAVLTNAVATHVTATDPTGNKDNSTALVCRTGGAGDVISYIYFPRPFPLRATILSAVIKFYTTSMPENVTHTYTFQRLNVAFSASKVTYNTRPTSLIAGTKTSTTVGPVTDKTEWSVDITDWMQTVSSGGVWYGIRILENEALLRYIYSEVNPAVDYRPRFEVSWSDAPATPTGLSPSGGRRVGLSRPTLRATYLDVSGSTSLQAVQAQLNTSDVWNAVAPGPIFDTGIALTSVPEVDLTQPYAHTISATTINTNTNITATAGTFETADIGQPITGTGIQAATTITAVAAGGASATLSLAANASGTNTMTITRTYAGLADLATIYWRVRFQDAAGIWSAYSAAASFMRDDKGVLAVSNPSSGTPTVTDATPPINWSLTGETQSAYQISIFLPGNPVEVWTSGKTTSTAVSFTLPTGVLTKSGTTYTVTVRVWDNKQREATPGDPTYSEITRNFTFTPSGAVTAPTGLAATPHATEPKVALVWSRATAPDTFNIYRNSVLLAKVTSGEVSTGGTGYAWTDYVPHPQRLLSYSVQAVVTGVASSGLTSTTATVNSTGIWLRDYLSPDDATYKLRLAGADQPAAKFGDHSGVLEPIGPTSGPVIISQTVGPLAGSVNGRIVDYGGLTAQQWRDAYLNIHNAPTRKYILTMGDISLIVICREFSYSQLSLPIATVMFDVAFEYYQQNPTGSFYSTFGGLP